MEGTAVAVYSANCYPFRLSLNASDVSLLTTIPESIFRTDSVAGTDELRFLSHVTILFSIGFRSIFQFQVVSNRI